MLLGIPPSSDWLSYCIDEALHVLTVGHDRRDMQWAERFRREEDDGDLYGKIRSDPRTGSPPSAQDMAQLAAAQGDG